MGFTRAALPLSPPLDHRSRPGPAVEREHPPEGLGPRLHVAQPLATWVVDARWPDAVVDHPEADVGVDHDLDVDPRGPGVAGHVAQRLTKRSEEHTSELQSLMRISYAVFCLTKKNTT